MIVSPSLILKIVGVPTLMLPAAIDPPSTG